MVVFKELKVSKRKSIIFFVIFLIFEYLCIKARRNFVKWISVIARIKNTKSKIGEEHQGLLSNQNQKEMCPSHSVEDQSDGCLSNAQSDEMIIQPSQSEVGLCQRCPTRLLKLFFPSGTFAKFFAAALVPASADQLIPLFFTGNIPNQSALALAGQFVFLGVLIEIVQEGIVNSLFYFVGQCYKTDRDLALQGLKLCMLVLLVLGSILSATILVFTSGFVDLIDTPAPIVEATKTFLWMSSFSFPLILLNSAVINHIYITTNSLIIVDQLFQVIWTFLLNYFLFGRQSSSLQWGIDQFGYYKIIQSFVNLVNNLLFFLIIEKISPKKFLWDIPLTKDLKQNFRKLFNVSWGNFGDSAVRNFFYFMVTLKFINNLGETEAGAWNLLNTIIWGFLLIPSFTVANYIKVSIGHGAALENSDLRLLIKKVARESFLCLSCWLSLLSLVGVFCWPLMAKYFSPNNEDVQDLSTTMFYHVGWIFLIFSFNNAMDSLFFGTGRTSYIFYQSLITNFVVYFVPWVLYLVGVLNPTYWWVLGLYISGMLVDFCLTSYFCISLWNQIS